MSWLQEVSHWPKRASLVKACFASREVLANARFCAQSACYTSAAKLCQFFCVVSETAKVDFAHYAGISWGWQQFAWLTTRALKKVRFASLTLL